ncbi:uncharacterized protein LOC143888372 [Tasmannia lanceolata]|uniref:uncharacterized protein LOC143888372 n=1 Tax=Tasmannia lanceolata TaxID=3420 RepID=UPI004062E3B0
MGMSEKKIRKVSGYFMNKMGLKISYISRNPDILSLSLEKRIHPRCSIMQILMSEGLIDKDLKLVWVLKLTEKDFMEKFLIKNEEKVPKILSVYQNMIGAVELDNWSKELETGRLEFENSRAGAHDYLTIVAKVFAVGSALLLRGLPSKLHLFAKSIRTVC